MEEEFDVIIPRKDTQSNKWKNCNGDTISLSIADMDFRSPIEIVNSIKERLDHGIFGYTSESESLEESITRHLVSTYGWKIRKDAITYLPGSVCALFVGIRAFSSPGDRIIIPGPVYHNLTLSAKLSSRKAIHINMELDSDDRWVPNFSELDLACRDKDSKIILLCNPHNPGGTVYRRHELEKINEIAKENNMIVISDEVHCDLILSGRIHIPFSTLNSDAKNRTITLMSPSKTFNLSGFGFSYAIIEDDSVRDIFNNYRKGIVPFPGIVGLVAAQSAYQYGSEWRVKLIRYLLENRGVVRDKLKETPLIFHSLEATFLEWIDVSNLKIKNPDKFFLKNGVKILDGKDFGKSGFIRLNFACPRPILNEALDRMLTSINSI